MTFDYNAGQEVDRTRKHSTQRIAILAIAFLLLFSCGCIGNGLNATVYSKLAHDVSYTSITGGTAVDKYIFPVTIVNYAETPFRFDRMDLSYGDRDGNKSSSSFTYDNITLEKGDEFSDMLFCFGANYDPSEDQIIRMELVSLADNQSRVVWAGQTDIPKSDEFQDGELVQIYFKEEM